MFAHFLQAPLRRYWQGHPELHTGTSTVAVARHNIKAWLSQAFSWNLTGDKLLDSFPFLAEFDFSLKVVGLADIFFLMRLSKSKPLVSPGCSVLFQALYFCLTLTGELLPHNSTKNHLIFKRFKLLVSFPLSFLATIKLFINYSPWILKAFHPPQMVWAALLNQPVLANVASFTSSLSALYSLPLLSGHPSVRVCPLATAIPSAAQAGTCAVDSQGIYCFLSKAKPNLPTSHLTQDSYFPLHPASMGKGLPETPPGNEEEERGSVPLTGGWARHPSCLLGLPTQNEPNPPLHHSPQLAERGFVGSGAQCVPGTIAGVRAQLVTWLEKLINVKVRKHGVKQKGNGRLFPQGSKLLNSHETICARSRWYVGYAGCWCGSSPEPGVTVLCRLNHVFLCNSPNYPVLIFLYL